MIVRSVSAQHTHLPAFDEVVGEPTGPDQMMWVIGAQQQFVRVTEIYLTGKKRRRMLNSAIVCSCACYVVSVLP